MQDEAVIFAQKFLEDILSFYGLNTSVTSHLEEDVIELSAPSSSMNGFLIGHAGDNLRAMQHITMQAIMNKGFGHFRVNIDIADYKKSKNEKLATQAREWAKHVLETGEPMNLRPMNAADRRVVHQALGEFDGLTSGSEGEGRDRHIVITKS